jgi:ParB family chromosome partitioning protein
MARKNLLANITEDKLTTVNSAPATPAPAMPFARHGAFGAVTRTIDDLAAKAQDIEARLVAGEKVVELDPASIDASFIADRLTHDDEAFRTLVEAMQSRGQDSPILVRPHPSAPGRYQVAFGHRRLRAAKTLGRQVRAVVKNLTDRDLVLAQGQENSARADLSFIERALFAHRLEEAGHDRETIMASLSVDKTVVSRMIFVASRIPQSVIEAIGPASSTGRDRWVEFAQAFTAIGQSQVNELIASPAFADASSDERFNLLARLAPSSPSKRQPNDPRRRPSTINSWTNAQGRPFAQMKTTKRAVSLVIDRLAAPKFGEFMAERLDALYAEYLAETEQKRS